MSGLIGSTKRDEYVKTAMNESEVQILTCDEQGNEKSLFCDILKDFKCYLCSEGVMVELCIYSGSKRMDDKTYKRSFQREGYTYKQIVDLCNQGDVESSIIMTDAKRNVFIRRGNSAYKCIKSII